MSSPILNSIHWTVVEPLKDRKPGEWGADAVCLRCGNRWTLPTPVAVSALPWLMRGFQEMHRYCRDANPVQVREALRLAAERLGRGANHA